MCFFPSASLIDGERDEVGATIEDLRKSGEVYEGRLPPPKGGNLEDWEDREQTLFRSTGFGDDVDRPLLKVGRELHLFCLRHCLSPIEGGARIS